MLLRIIEKDRRLRNFTEVIGFGLGARGEAVVTALFLIEIGVWV
jgi:vesicular inhibitory amino acid transporter